MIKFERVYRLESKTFIVSNNVDDFPVQLISFSSPELNEEINGILQGEGMDSGRFTGRFIETDRIELYFSWYDEALSRIVIGRIFGFICGCTSEKLKIFINWYLLYGKIGYGAASYNQL